MVAGMMRTLRFNEVGSSETVQRPVRWAPLTGLAAAVLLSGCAVLDQTPDPGPLGEGAGEDSGEICVPASPSGEYALGTEVLRNPSGDDAVITGLRLVEAKGVELVGAVVVDLNGSSSLGARTSWPPSGQENTPQWRAAVPADGATIPAGSANQKILVLHLRAPNQPASLGSYKVAYEIDGDEYEMQTTFALQIKSKCFRRVGPSRPSRLRHSRQLHTTSSSRQVRENRQLA
jgi:hypothetical protein